MWSSFKWLLEQRLQVVVKIQLCALNYFKGVKMHTKVTNDVSLMVPPKCGRLISENAFQKKNKIQGI